MKTIYFILTFLIAITVSAQEHRPEIHCKHFFYGYPYGTPETNDLIVRDIYALSNNDSTKFADWVAYRLTMHEVDGELTVKKNWKVPPVSRVFYHQFIDRSCRRERSWWQSNFHGERHRYL